MTLGYLDSYLKTQLGRTPETIRSYRDSLSLFRKYLYREKNISIAGFQFSCCTRELLLEYTAYLRENGSLPATCNVRLAAIKNYVRSLALLHGHQGQNRPHFHRDG